MNLMRSLSVGMSFSAGVLTIILLHPIVDEVTILDFGVEVYFLVWFSSALFGRLLSLCL